MQPGCNNSHLVNLRFPLVYCLIIRNTRKVGPPPLTPGRGRWQMIYHFCFDISGEVPLAFVKGLACLEAALRAHAQPS